MRHGPGVVASPEPEFPARKTGSNPKNSDQVLSNAYNNKNKNFLIFLTLVEMRKKIDFEDLTRRGFLTGSRCAC